MRARDDERGARRPERGALPPGSIFDPDSPRARRLARARQAAQRRGHLHGRADSTRPWVAQPDRVLRDALSTLADAVLLTALRDAADDSPVDPATRADALAFLHDVSGPAAESRQIWLALAGYRVR